MKDQRKNYEKDGDKVSIYCKPYTKGRIDVIAELEGREISEMVEILLGMGIEIMQKKYKQEKPKN